MGRNRWRIQGGAVDIGVNARPSSTQDAKHRPIEKAVIAKTVTATAVTTNSRGPAMDMIAGTVLRPGVAHGPLRIVETLPEGRSLRPADGNDDPAMGGRDALPPGLGGAVVAVRGSAAARLVELMAALSQTTARPVA